MKELKTLEELKMELLDEDSMIVNKMEYNKK